MKAIDEKTCRPSADIIKEMDEVCSARLCDAFKGASVLEAPHWTLVDHTTHQSISNYMKKTPEKTEHWVGKRAKF